MFTNSAQHAAYFGPMDFHRDEYARYFGGINQIAQQQIQALIEAQRRFEYLRSQPKWYMEFIPSLGEANRLFQSELLSLPFDQRQLVFLEQALIGEHSPLKGLSIVRARKNESEETRKEKTSKRKTTFKTTPVRFIQNLVVGIVKIAFAPLKINLESLHPTRILA